MSAVGKVRVKRSTSSGQVKLSFTVAFDPAGEAAPRIWENVGLLIGSILTPEEGREFLRKLAAAAEEAGVRSGGAK